MFGELRTLGIVDAYLFSGDKQANVQVIAAAVGITQFAGDLSAEEKVARVAALEQTGRRVLMVGDGTNDAPSLSTATVGVALAGHGGGVVAEAADVVLLIEDPARSPEAVGMAFASAGQLTPVAGALIQEAIDIAVILNALRAARA